jgi:hypothetical protein
MIERRDLVSATKELIEVLGLKDHGEPIVINRETSVEDMTKIIKDAIPLIDPKTDTFEDETQTVIDELSKPAETEKVDKKAGKKTKPVKEDDADEDARQQKKAEELHQRDIGSKKVNEGRPPVKEEKEEDKEDKPVKKVERKGAPKKAGEPGKPGIIATIVKAIEKSGKKGISKKELLEVLTEEFPDRNIDSMSATISVQCPTRINKEKFPLVKVGEDRYAKA